MDEHPGFGYEKGERRKMSTCSIFLLFSYRTCLLEPVYSARTRKQYIEVGHAKS